jgi:hypothetical protein
MLDRLLLRRLRSSKLADRLANKARRHGGAGWGFEVREMSTRQLDLDQPVPVGVHNNGITAQTISLWITPVCGAIFLAAFLLFPGFRPPMSPNMPADQVAAFFRDHAAMIRLSMIIYDLCGIMLVPFFMLIVVQMKRMATPSQVFAYSYLSAVATGATLFAVADLFWLMAAFRPERSPELVVLLNDMAWIVFTAPVGMLIAQNICLALAIYLDAHPRPIFPRWVAHFNLVCAVVMAPAALAAVVRTGPLAWNGFVSFWLKIVTFSLFIVVMFVVLRTAITRQALEEKTAP